MRSLSGTYLLPVFILLLGPKLDAKEVVVTITRTEHKPVIDAVLDDPTWADIEPITGFMQYVPVEGVAPSESTELYIAYDDDNFYLAFKCYDSEVSEIRATMAQREEVDNDDVIGFAFDTYNSEREAFLFNVNPYGIVSDFIWQLGRWGDPGWDADVRSRGRIVEDGYCIEIAVPFKALRMPSKEEQEWGFYALRSIKRKGEMAIWPPRTHKISNLQAQAALLKGIKGVKTGSHFALLPYVFSSYKGGSSEQDRPFDLGIDLRYGITSNLMVDLTLNPDYSQIEADPDEIELTERYGQELREKRPFFTEGTDVFASNQALLYSRIISNPLIGLKFTGKIGKYRVGILSVADDASNNGSEDYYSVLRVRRDVLKESSVGILALDKDNFQDGTHNRIVSMDGNFRLGDIYSLKSQVTRSMTKDVTGTYGETGYNLNLERLGANVYNGIWYNDFPEGFDAQTGYMLPVLGYREIGTHDAIFLRKPFEWIDQIELHGELNGRFNYEDELKEDHFSVSAEASLDRIWTKFEFSKNHEWYNEQDLRYSEFEYELWNTPVRYMEHYLSVIWGGAVEYEESFVGWSYQVEYDITLKPLSRVVYNMNFAREDLYHEYGGKRHKLQNVVWTKLSYKIVQNAFLRGIYQYNDLDKRSDASLLFAYEYRPLSNIYAGMNLNDFATGKQVADNLEAFVKIGYLWRL